MGLKNYFSFWVILFCRAVSSKHCPAEWMDPGDMAENCYRVSPDRMDWGTAQEVDKQVI